MRGDDSIWTPTEEQKSGSRLWRFLKRHGCRSYQDLCSRAASEPEWFWKALIDELAITFSRPYEKVMDTSAGIPFTRFFAGAGLNAFDFAVARHATSQPDQLALLTENESGLTAAITYRELEERVTQAAAGLSKIGVGKGVAIGLYLPLIAETAIALLACARLGAVAVPLFSGYGEEAIRQRLVDAGARVLITADAAIRRGRANNMKAIADLALSGSPSVEHLVVVRCAGPEVSLTRSGEVWWHELVRGRPEAVPPEVMDPQDPFLLLYTSGTTGRPKGTVHGQAGLPIKAAQDWAFGMDVRPGDRVLWVTDMGWVMGPLLIFGSLVLGATAVLYDGAVDHPDPGRLWQVAARQGVTHLGLSPTVVRVLIPFGESWPQRHPLPHLRVMASTGEPWTPEAWEWLFRIVGGGRVPIMNYSGGTECGGGLVSGNYLTPARPGSFAGPIPGVDASVFGEDGKPVTGQVGELVVRKPYLGMTLGVWKDRERYLQTYWSRWPDVWVHGDWAMVDGDGLWYILGRSDDTIKVAGKRVGPAELEAAALDGTGSVEAAAVGIPDPLKGQSVVVFVVAGPGSDPSQVASAVSGSIERSLGKPFRPHAVLVVPRLPKTRNGKILRRVIRNVYVGDPPGDLSSLDDLASLEPIRALRGSA